MKRNKKGISPTYVLEVKRFDIHEIICSLVEMFSVFKWNKIYKNPFEDKKLNELINKLEKYIIKNYEEE